MGNSRHLTARRYFRPAPKADISGAGSVQNSFCITELRFFRPVAVSITDASRLSSETRPSPRDKEFQARDKELESKSLGGSRRANHPGKARTASTAK